METFINETILDDVSICDQLIEYHSNNIEHKKRGQTTAIQSKQGKVSTDVGVYVSNQNPIVQKYFHEVLKSAKKYKEKYHIQNVLKLTIKEGFNIQHYAPNEGFFNWHCERNCYQSHQRALVFMTYLNDVNDGGETEFLHQQVKVKPIKGKTVIWPTDFTHMHRGITSKSEHKYIATGWLHFRDAIDFQRELLDGG